jgi:hypothetical protein
VKVVCLASGPSLTPEDVQAVKEWRGEGRLVYVANTTYQAAPWADVLFAMDGKWWCVHYDEVRETFAGELTTTANVVREKLVKVDITQYRNSGANCISLAVKRGAKEVVMLGFDCMPDQGVTHWHGSHPPGLSDAKTIKVWPLIFDRLAKDMKRKGVRVVNASRRTALKGFERVNLEDAIGAAVFHP